MKKTLYLIALAIVSIFTSCEKDGSAPKVHYADVNGMEVGAKINPGAQIVVNYNVGDREGLSQVFLSFEKGYPSESEPIIKTENDYSTLKVRNISSTIANGKFTLTIPENATPGTYSAIIKVTDKGGNESLEKKVGFIILAQDPPQFNINVIEPIDFNGTTIQTQRSGKIVLDGNIVSNVDLSSLKVDLVSRERAIYTSGQRNFSGSQDFEVTIGEDENGRLSFFVPVDAIPDQFYRIMIHAADKNNAVALKEINVNVKF